MCQTETIEMNLKQFFFNGMVCFCFYIFKLLFLFLGGWLCYQYWVLKVAYDSSCPVLVTYKQVAYKKSVYKKYPQILIQEAIQIATCTSIENLRISKPKLDSNIWHLLQLSIQVTKTFFS